VVNDKTHEGVDDDDEQRPGKVGIEPLGVLLNQKRGGGEENEKNEN